MNEYRVEIINSKTEKVVWKIGPFDNLDSAMRSQQSAIINFKDLKFLFRITVKPSAA